MYHEKQAMKHTKIQVMLIGLLMVAAASAEQPAATKSSISTSERQVIANRLFFFERAADNREFAACTQMAHGSSLEKQAIELQESGVVNEGDTAETINKKVGALQNSAAILYGTAAENFDQAAVNQRQVVKFSARLGKLEKQRHAQTCEQNLKMRADAAIQAASEASERAAMAYDSANVPANAALASQQAAVWLEKLAIR